MQISITRIKGSQNVIKEGEKWERKKRKEEEEKKWKTN